MRFFFTAGIMLCSLVLSEAALWQAPCASAFRNSVAGLLDRDRVIEADSVFSIMESECSMDAFLLMKWMQVKGVLSQFSESGRIACLIVQKQPDLASLIQEQLIDIIKEARIDTVRRVLKRYYSCVVSLRQNDTAAVKQWIAGAYHRFALYNEELLALMELDSKNFPSANDFLSCARDFFSKKLFTETIRSALSAYSRVHEPAQKSLCAFMLYQAYSQTGKNDSAAFWLEKFPLTRIEFKAQAIVFLQGAGYAGKADSLIGTIPRSFMRDTLALRQKMVTADLEGASALALRLAKEYSSGRERNELMLWRIRSLAFSGKGGEADELMDSVDFSPGMSGAEEFLSLKYKWATIRKSPDAWRVFGAVAYASWLKRPEMAYRALESSGLDSSCDPDARQMIVLDGARTLMEGGMLSNARTVMERIKLSLARPEFYYYYGEVLFKTGAVDSARKVLETLLLMHPGDVFSEKARIFLERMRDKRNEGGRYGDTMDEKRDY